MKKTLDQVKTEFEELYKLITKDDYRGLDSFEENYIEDLYHDYLNSDLDIDDLKEYYIENYKQILDNLKKEFIEKEEVKSIIDYEPFGDIWVKVERTGYLQ